MRKTPFCGMFDCIETEHVAYSIVKYFAHNGDTWRIPVNFDYIKSQLGKDYNNYIGRANFIGRFIAAGCVTDDFISIVHRINDNSQFQDSIIESILKLCRLSKCK